MVPRFSVTPSVTNLLMVLAKGIVFNLRGLYTLWEPPFPSKIDPPARTVKMWVAAIAPDR
jgi:hypothetical protein